MPIDRSRVAHHRHASGGGLLVVVVDPTVSLGMIVLLGLLYVAVYRQLQGRCDRAARSHSALAGAHQRRRHGNRRRVIRELRMLGCEEQFAARFRTAARTPLPSSTFTVNVVERRCRAMSIETAAFALDARGGGHLIHKLGGWQTAAPLLAFTCSRRPAAAGQSPADLFEAMLIQQNARVVDALAELIVPTAAPPALQRRRVAAAGAPDRPWRSSRVTYRYPGARKARARAGEHGNPCRAKRSGVRGHNRLRKKHDHRPDRRSPFAAARRHNAQSSAPRPDMAPAWRARMGYVPQVPICSTTACGRNIAFGSA